VTTVRKRLEFILRPGNSLGRRAANAGFWTFMRSISIRLLRTGRAFIIARLIAPEDWGLMGIAFLVVNLVTRFSQTGVSAALIQRKGQLSREDIDTAWTIETIRGLLLAALAAGAAPVAGAFFQNAEATSLVRVMAVGLVLRGVANTAVVDFDRELEFQRRFVYRTLPHLVEAFVSIGLALLLQSAWALVIGWLAGRFTYTLASFLVHPHRPKLRFDVSEARRILSFGKWIFGVALLQYALLHIDDIFVARLTGAASLGFYQMAYTMSQLAATEITNVTSTVAFPAFAIIQDKPERLSRAYIRTVRFVALLSAPLTAGIWFLGTDLVNFVLGSRWRPLLPALGVLLIWGLIRAISGPAEPLVTGIGHPKYVTRSKALQLLFLAVLIYPLTNTWGIVGAAWATVISALSAIWLVVVANRQSHTSLAEYFKAIAFPSVASLLMVATLQALKISDFLPGGAMILLWAPVLGAAIYFGILHLARRFLGYATEGILPKMHST
jgi:O-antigen/teichoic acid export membrane protein